MTDNIIPRYQPIEQLQKQARSMLLDAGITNLESGSAGIAFMDGMMTVVNRNYRDTEIAFRNAHLSTAAGIYLDLYGRDLGLPREGISRIETLNNQKFFVPRGVLGDYTEGRDLTLGPGVVVRNTSNSVSYEVVPFVGGSGQYPIWRATEREVFVKTRSVSNGAEANTPAGSLTVHNIPVRELLTNNVRAIQHGKSAESDEDYRARLIGFGISAQGSNELAIQNAALQESDVDSVIIVRYVQGPGSYMVIVVPREGAGDSFLEDRVKTRIQAVSGVGDRPFVRRAKVSEFAVSLRVKSNDEPTTVAESVRTAVLEYLSRINAGDTIVVSAIESAVQQLDTVSSVTLTAMRLGNEAKSPRDLRLDTDEIIIVPAPVQTSIKVDVVT